MMNDARSELWREAWQDGFEQGQQYARLPPEGQPKTYLIPAPPPRRTAIGSGLDRLREYALVPRWVLGLLLVSAAAGGVRLVLAAGGWG